MIYKWKPGTRAKADPQIAGEVCEKLEREGRLTAEELVNVSRPKSAPLHNEFNWNDKEAAELFRQYQARTLIAHLVIAEEDTGKEPTRAFFCVSEATSNYDSVQVVIEDVDKLRLLRERALSELIAIQRRYSMIQELDSLRPLIEELQKKRP